MLWEHVGVTWGCASWGGSHVGTPTSIDLSVLVCYGFIGLDSEGMGIGHVIWFENFCLLTMVKRARETQKGTLGRHDW